MKIFPQLAVLTISLAGIIQTYGDAVVNLDNYHANTPIYLFWSPQSKASMIYYEVLAGPVGSSLSPLIPYGATNSIFTSNPAIDPLGYFDVGLALIPGVSEGAEADFILRAWCGDPGSSYDTAPVKGESARWTQTVGSWSPNTIPPMLPAAPPLEIPGPIQTPQTNHFLFTTKANGECSFLLDPPPLFSSYQQGTTVTVTAVPKPGSEFVSWGGTYASTSNPLQITIEGDTELVAYIAKVWTLNVTATEGGTLLITPQHPFYRNRDFVRILAIPLTEYFFAGWKGDFNSNNRMLNVMMTTNYTMIAYFERLPVITNQPMNHTLTYGSQAILTVGVTGEKITYQWYRNSESIAAATNASYTLPPATVASAGWYFCRIDYTMGSIDSQSAYISLTGPFPPYASLQLWTHSVAAGEPATFFANAYDNAGSKFDYGWYKDGVFLTNSQNPVLSIKPVTPSDQGQYWFVVTNITGATTSPVAILSVLPPLLPRILVQPKSSVVYVGEKTALHVDAYGWPSISYQWQHQGTNLLDATNAFLEFDHVQPADAGPYRVLVKNETGSTPSAPATIEVRLTPKIVAVSHDLVLGEGNRAHFWVEAVGLEPLFYQWQYNGTNLLGATNHELILPEATIEQSGLYSIIVSNALGKASRLISLTVKPGPQIMGLHLAEGSIALTIKTKPGKSYIIETSTDLIHWSEITNFLSNQDMMPCSVPILTGQANVFYRVKLNET